jgi:hypothetical protein
MTETEPIPNPVAVDSERDAGMSKKRKDLWKPNTEPPPNRIHETAIGCAAMSGKSCCGDPALSAEGVGQNAQYSKSHLLCAFPIDSPN